MRYLPKDFPPDGLSAVEVYRLEYFYEHFVVRNSTHYGHGHFVLACYAALPAVLTADLLHQLWLNFKTYAWGASPATIHPVAPADILLSPLVEEIGLELYEMSEPIRKALLVYWKKKVDSPGENEYGLLPLASVAQFLLDYAQRDFTPGNPDDNAFREAQEWTALSYLDPGRAFAKVAQAFQDATSKASRGRYRDAIEKMSARFALEIVSNPQSIPPAYKAMTALTSVVRDVLLKREPKKLEELQAEVYGHKNLLTDAPVQDNNVISIEVLEQVGEKIRTKKEKSREPKVWALIVGIDHYDSSHIRSYPDAVSNANRVLELLGRKVPASQLTLLTGAVATKPAVLEAWHALIASAKEEDNVLFFIAAHATREDDHCYAACYDSEDFFRNKSTWLADAEVGQLAKRVHCNSMTFVLEVNHAATPHWLDVSNGRNAVFASLKYHQEAAYPAPVSDLGGDSMTFSRGLLSLLPEKQHWAPNRALFAGALRACLQAPVDEAGLSGRRYGWHFGEADQKDPVWAATAPQLLCAPHAYNRLFLEGTNRTAQLQDLLRQTGYYHEENTGQWDTQTAKALSAYRKDANFPDHTSKAEYIRHLEGLRAEQSANHVPLYVLVFSDPKKELDHIKQEKKRILDLLQPNKKVYRLEVLTLDTPDRSTLTSTIKDKNNRNRLQLFYYSGPDNKGDFVLKDGKLTIADFVELLPFQENIQLLVANTCRSKYFAEYTSQLGVRMAIGSDDKVDDDFGADFGVKLFRAIVSNGSLGEIVPPPDSEQRFARHRSSQVSNDKRENQFYLFQAPWNNRGTVVAELKPTTKVFISSTYVELMEYREVVKNKLAGTGLVEFIGLEEPTVSLNKIQHYIAECNIFIGIYANRYGSIPDRSGRSIIEREYNHAQQLGKPMLCYLLEDEQTLSVHENALEPYHQLMEFKRRVADNQEVKKFTTPDDLAAKVVADLQKTIALRSAWKYNNKRILVVGSGNYQLSPEVHFASEAIGRMLAEEGYGLISGGWPGVDYVVAQAYTQRLKTFVVSEKEYLIQCVYRDPEFKGGTVNYVKRDRDWYEKTLSQADALVLIGGTGGTYSTYKQALTKRVPVIPLPTTAGAAEVVYHELLEAEGQPVSLHLLSGLRISITNAASALEVSEKVKEILRDPVVRNLMEPEAKSLLYTSKSMVDEIGEVAKQRGQKLLSKNPSATDYWASTAVPDPARKYVKRKQPDNWIKAQRLKKYLKNHKKSYPLASITERVATAAQEIKSGV